MCMYSTRTVVMADLNLIDKSHGENHGQNAKDYYARTFLKKVMDKLEDILLRNI